MDKFLRPERFDGGDAVPGDWEHWFKIFTNFVSSLTDLAPDKLKLLVNYVSPSIYSHIKDCTTYEEAVKTLQSVYVKPVNEVFARHQLATRKQQPSEYIDQILQNLKLLSKDCGFKAVSVSVYAQESIRDAFISVLSSSAIRQRLLEKHSLSLDEAIQHARSLELAQRNAECYVSSTPSTPSAALDASNRESRCTACFAPGESGALAADAPLHYTNAAVVGRRCYFCGGGYHPRPKCPARNQTCWKCGKLGHFSSTCKSSTRSRNKDARNSSAVSLATLLTASASTVGSSSIYAIINGLEVCALVDSGSAISFINDEIAKRLHIPTSPSKEYVSMAQCSLVTASSGHCVADLRVNNNLYKS